MSDFAQAENLIGPSGGMVAIDPGSRARTRPRSDFEQAVIDGRAFAFASVTFDPNAHNTILAVQNDDLDRDLHIQRIVASSDTASQIQVFESVITTIAGTAVPAINLNRSSGRAAKAKAYANETGQDEQGGGYTKLLFRDLLAANTSKTIEINGAIVLPARKAIGIDLTTAATGANMTIFGWFQ